LQGKVKRLPPPRASITPRSGFHENHPNLHPGRSVPVGTAVALHVGLGIEIDEEMAAKHPFAPEVTMPAFYRDGSVADW
jgi:hypothetical protein